MAAPEPPDTSPAAATAERDPGELDARADALRALAAARVPHLVGGAYAFFAYTGIYRDTKDLDVFIRFADLEDAFRALEAEGFRTELTDPGWIAKAFRGEWFVDLIFSSGNGVAVVDEAWFTNARPTEVMGVQARITPPEEMIWSKSFVLERERYDGADVNHLLHACARDLDWDRLLARFDRYPEVLLSHLLMFSFVYPGHRDEVPNRVMELLWERTRQGHPLPPGRVCRGPLVSRHAYGHDLAEHGLLDGRSWDEGERASRPGPGGAHAGVPARGGG
ncbi:MAG: nucleotidyltransferase [Anaeromyxobacteraceae bacterium]